jgi:serine/threonine protein kinase
VPSPPHEEAGNALPVGTQLDEFEILGVLGEGGFGIVYRAHDHSLGRQVALKEYMPATLASRSMTTHVSVRSERHRETYRLGLNSFVNEARLLAQFDHPALVKVHRFWQANGTAYMVMPLYEGVTLREHLKRLSSPPDPGWLLNLLDALTEALAVMHRQQCYHRDIAPDNILLLAGEQRPVLLDFGAARRVISDATQHLTVILKPGYAPIEQYAEEHGVRQGPWTDLYALAAVVHLAISGKTPPPSVARLMTDSLVPLSSAPPVVERYGARFVEAIDRALSVRPEDRPQSVEAFRQMLGLSAQSREATPPPRPIPEPPVDRPPAPPPPRAPAAVSAPPSRTRWVLPAGAAALVLAAAAGYIVRQPAPAPAPVSAPASAAARAAPAPAAPSEAVTAAPAPLPAPSAAPPAVAANGPDDFAAIVQGAAPQFDVRVDTPRTQLRMNRDPLEFTVTSQRDGHVYVIAQDPDGARVLLFPNSRSANNRIQAGQPLKLPQPSWPLVALPPAGREHLLVIVSSAPRDHTAASLGKVHWFKTLAGSDQASTPGASTRLLGEPVGCADEACKAYGAARFAVTIGP